MQMMKERIGAMRQEQDLQPLVDAAGKLMLEQTDGETLRQWIWMLDEPMRAMSALASKGQMQVKVAQLSMVNVDLQNQLIQQRERATKASLDKYKMLSKLKEVAKISPEVQSWLETHFPMEMG